MATDDPRDEQGSPFGYDTLRRLERRLDEASEAAERLIADAASEALKRRPRPAEAAPRPRPPDAEPRPRPADAEVPRRPPPAGWQAPRADEERDSDLELLAQLLQSARDRIPPELQRRLAEALRELLLALRALIDWYLERLERRRAEPAEVKDIPIL
jgi:hypothetical protein